MRIVILDECGMEAALLGLGLSYDITSDMIFLDKKAHKKMAGIARNLAGRDSGENKFLESLQIWIDITAPRYWWSQFDTYRIGITKQSQSTMHTLMRHEICQPMFAETLPNEFLAQLEKIRQEGAFTRLKALLPECFQQRRIVNMNYKTLRNIINQRKNHKLNEWNVFCKFMEENAEHYEFLFGG